LDRWAFGMKRACRFERTFYDDFQRHRDSAQVGAEGERERQEPTPVAPILRPARAVAMIALVLNGDRLKGARRAFFQRARAIIFMCFSLSSFDALRQRRAPSSTAAALFTARS
jgi:hypothetical protein